MVEPTSSPHMEFTVELRVNIGPTLEIGTGSFSTRRTVPITGGTFSGPQISGRVLPGGADWQVVENDSLTFLDARYVIETDDKVRIEVRNTGIRYAEREVMQRMASGEQVSPDEYYFRTSPRFSPPEGKYGWLRQSIFIASAERYADLVVVKVWRVL